MYLHARPSPLEYLSNVLLRHGAPLSGTHIKVRDSLLSLNRGHTALLLDAEVLDGSALLFGQAAGIAGRGCTNMEQR